MNQFLEELYSRFNSLLNRNVVVKVDNNHKNQLIYTLGLFNQEKEVEVIEPYGMTVWPVEDKQAETIRYAYQGVEDFSMSHFASGGIYRPLDADYGEVINYSYLDAEDKHRIHFKKDWLIDIFSTAQVSTKYTPESIISDVQGTATATIEPSFIELNVESNSLVTLQPDLVNLNVNGTANVAVEPSKITLDVEGQSVTAMTPDVIEHDVQGSSNVKLELNKTSIDVDGVAKGTFETNKITLDVAGTGLVEVEADKVTTSVGGAFVEVTDSSITLSIGANQLVMTAGASTWTIQP